MNEYLEDEYDLEDYDSYEDYASDDWPPAQFTPPTPRWVITVQIGARDWVHVSLDLGKQAFSWTLKCPLTIRRHNTDEIPF